MTKATAQLFFRAVALFVCTDESSDGIFADIAVCKGQAQATQNRPSAKKYVLGNYFRNEKFFPGKYFGNEIFSRISENGPVL